MGSKDETQSDAAPRRLIYNVRERAIAAVDAYEDEKLGNSGAVSEQTRKSLVVAALSYRRCLNHHRGEKALDTPWEKRNIHWIEEMAGEYVEAPASSNTANGNGSSGVKPALLEVDPERIKDVILELNEVAKELGFAASIAQKTAQAGRV